jgi:hypothetical protein
MIGIAADPNFNISSVTNKFDRFAWFYPEFLGQPNGDAIARFEGTGFNDCIHAIVYTGYTISGQCVTSHKDHLEFEPDSLNLCMQSGSGIDEFLLAI